jgi:hypothetical protein
MKQTLSLLFITALLATSCSKSNDQSNTTPQTPLEKAIDKQYIHTGAADNSLEVEYSTFKPNEDCDKAVFDAAIQTIQIAGSINKVVIIGANLTMTFDRGSNDQPSKTQLTSSSALYKATHKDWAYKGFLRITKQNSFLTQDQFDKAIIVKATARNTGDEAKILTRNIAGDLMIVEYALTKANPTYSRAIDYEVQASTPITLRSQVTINCLIPGFFDTQTDFTLDLDKSLTAPEQKSLGGNVTSYTQELYPSGVTTTLSNYIAGQYFAKKVYPIIK